MLLIDRRNEQGAALSRPLSVERDEFTSGVASRASMASCDTHGSTGQGSVPHHADASHVLTALQSVSISAAVLYKWHETRRYRCPWHSVTSTSV